jgi:hypothetical protein
VAADANQPTPMRAAGVTGVWGCDTPGVTEQPPPDEQRDGTLENFRSWHRDRSFQREVYAQFLATLLAALVVYVVAAYAGKVDNKPLVVAFTGTTLFGALSLLTLMPRFIGNWSHVRPLFIVWNNRTDTQSVLAKQLYNSFIFRTFGMIMSGFMLYVATQA